MMVKNKINFYTYKPIRYSVLNFSNFLSSISKQGLLISYFMLFHNFLSLLKVQLYNLKIRFQKVKKSNVIYTYSSRNRMKYYLKKKNSFIIGSKTNYKSKKSLIFHVRKRNKNSFTFASKSKRILFNKHVLFAFKNILTRIDLKCKTILFYKSGKKYILPFPSGIKQRRASSIRLLMSHLYLRMEKGFLLKFLAEIMDLLFYRGVTFKPFFDFDKTVKDGAKLLYFLKKRKFVKKRYKFKTHNSKSRPWFHFIKKKPLKYYNFINLRCI